MTASLLLMVAASGSPAGELDAMRANVREDDAPAATREEPCASTPERYDGHSHDRHDAWDNMLTGLLGPVIFSPWLVPHLWLEANRPLLVGFVESPYADGHPGYMLSGMREDDTPFGTIRGRLSIEHGSNFDDLSRTSGRFFWETKSRWGIDSEWDYRRENLSRGRTDQLWTGDVNAIFRFAQSEGAQFYTGAGLNWLSDSAHTDLGFNLTYGADFFLSDPWILSTSLDAGTLGSSGLVHARGSIGYLWDCVELYGAYDFYHVGGVSQQGPAVGLRWWW